MNTLEILNKDSSNEMTIEINNSKSILDQMLDHKSKIIFGCFGGSCGSCKCEIIEGEKFINKEAIRPVIYKGINKNEFLPCIAKIKPNLKNKKIKIKKVL